MPSKRQIREAAVQFLYCADLEGGADAGELRDTFWDFLTETDRARLNLATYRTLHHLSLGREGRLAELVERAETVKHSLAAWPEAEPLVRSIDRMLGLESSWSTSLAGLARLAAAPENSSEAGQLGGTLKKFFATDRALSDERIRFLNDAGDFPALRATLEGISATLRRLQRISDRVRMIEEPDKFPDHADLEKLRESKLELHELRKQADSLIDEILGNKERIDALLAKVVENYQPERIDPVDRAVLRLAAHEINHGKVPTAVAINEAIELAKRFGTTESGRFVNGVLDKIARMTGSESTADF